MARNQETLTDLSVICIAAPITFGMYDTPRLAMLELSEPLDLRDIRDSVVPIGHHNSIKVFLPPVVTSFTRLSENDLPFTIHFTYKLHSRIIRNQILVSLAVHETLDIPLDSLPRPERGVCSVSSN
jgi:hypothetical protein